MPLPGLPVRGPAKAKRTLAGSMLSMCRPTWIKNPFDAAHYSRSLHLMKESARLLNPDKPSTHGLDVFGLVERKFQDGRNRIEVHRAREVIRSPEREPCPQIAGN